MAVGLGEPKHIKRYGYALAPSVTCFCNQAAAHTAFGLKRGTISQLFSASVVSSGIRAANNGVMQGEATGDSKMLSGTFIIDTQGVVQYAYYSKFAGDDPKIGDLLSALKTTL